MRSNHAFGARQSQHNITRSKESSIFKSVISSNTSLQQQQGKICKTAAPVKPASLTLQAPEQVAKHEDNLYKLINVDVSREDANGDGG